MRPFRFCPYCAQALTSRDEGERSRLACVCGFVSYDNPTPVLAAIVETEAGVVLARGRGWPEKMFGLPTGFLERGESPEEGVVREVKEELGLEVSNLKFVGLFSFPEQNQLIIAYAMKGTGNIVLNAELEEVKVIPRGRLRGWPFATGLAVNAWLAMTARESCAASM